MEFISINPFYFILLVIKYWNINAVFESLVKKYGNVDFVVNFYFKRVYLLNTNHTIKCILDHKSNDLTYIQCNLNTYLGHRCTINCVNSSEDAWDKMHRLLKRTLNQPGKKLKNIMEKNKYILFNKHYSLNEAVEMYICRVFAEFNYGKTVDFKKYMKTRKLILKYFKRFHQSRLVRIPFIGNLWSKFMHWFHKNDLTTIYNCLNELYLAKSDDCTINDLAMDIENNNFIESILNTTKLFFLETTMLLVLENDFVSSVMLDHIIQLGVGTLNDSVYNGFLYPVRYRVLNEQITCGVWTPTIEVMPKGSLVVYNLLNSGLYFSWGPRACVGQNMVKMTIWPFIQEIRKWVKLDRNKDWYLSKRTDNIPVVKAITEFEIKLPDDYIEKTIPCYSTNENQKMYDVISMYNNPLLVTYCTNRICQQITKMGLTAIVAPEARAFSLAGACAYKLKIPLFSIRKEGKLPGEVFSIGFNKGYTTKSDVLQISKQDLSQYKIALMDDGFASGGSAKTCIDLVSMCGGKIEVLFVVIKYTYCECIDIGIPVNYLFTIGKN